MVFAALVHGLAPHVVLAGAAHAAAASAVADDLAIAVHPSDQPGRDCLIADLQELASQPMQEALHVLGTD
eukprot:7330771-Alexandrium_andersonii.AAC.1